MHRVKDTAEYREGRRQEVYRAAFEGAVIDGTLTDREKEILSHVRRKLGISPELASQLEVEVASLFSENSVRA